MTVAHPEPGELVKTVVDLVEAVNSGGGTVDLSDYHAPHNVSINADGDDGDGGQVELAGIQQIYLTDFAGREGSGNGILWEAGGGDGEVTQGLTVFTGTN